MAFAPGKPLVSYDQARALLGQDADVRRKMLSTMLGLIRHERIDIPSDIASRRSWSPAVKEQEARLRKAHQMVEGRLGTQSYFDVEELIRKMMWGEK